MSQYIVKEEVEIELTDEQAAELGDKVEKVEEEKDEEDEE